MAPSRSCASASWIELRLVVPSSSRFEHQRLGAEPVGRIGGDAGVELDRDPGHRDGGAAGIDDLDAVRQAGALDVGEVELGDAVTAGIGRAAEVKAAAAGSARGWASARAAARPAPAACNSAAAGWGADLTPPARLPVTPGASS